MAVYKDNELEEQSIYGSSRLGLIKQSSQTAYRSLGGKKYELTNHLGNVLAVVSDNIHLDQENTWTSLINTTDYYPFGLAMDGRSVQDSTYRYGFNGKEEDSNGEWGSKSHYDYGFRIYNPTIAKFLSVDPLAKSYPMLTPYQFASNRPIDGIDLDGLEYLDFNVSTIRIAKGEALIKIENLSYTTQDIVSKFNSDTRFWDGNIGVNTSIKSYETEITYGNNTYPVLENYNENFDLEGEIKPFEKNYKIRIGIQKNRFGIEDQRFNERFVENSPASKLIGRRAYRSVALLEIGRMINTEVKINNWANDKSKIFEHIRLGERAMADVNFAFERGVIDLQIPSFMNYPGLEGLKDSYISNTLYQISNFVLQGDDGGDQKIRDLGKIVWDKISEK